MISANNRWKERGRSSSPPGGNSGGVPIHLNFRNHCLLCLQHVDASVLEEIAQENLLGLHNIQSILLFLMGTVNLSSGGKGDGGGGSSKCYPVTSNLPPLCMPCYESLRELHKTYAEAMEVQRKIQNMTKAARGIVKGGMRAEFFNRLKTAGCPKEEMERMEYFIGNFHDLIVEADRKSVLPFTFNDPSSSESSKETGSLKPYFVQFAVAESSPFKSPQIVSISSDGAASPPVSPGGETFRRPAPPQIEERLMLGDEVCLVISPAKVDNGKHQKKLEDAEDDDVVVDEVEGDKEIEEREDILVEEVEVEETSKAPETDVDCWKGALSSLVTIENVEEEGGAPNREETEEDDTSILEQPQKNIELINLDDEDEEEEDLSQEEIEEDLRQEEIEEDLSQEEIEEDLRQEEIEEDLSQEEIEEDLEDVVDDGDFEIEYCSPGSPYSSGQPVVLASSLATRRSSRAPKKVSKNPSHKCSVCSKKYHSAQYLRHHQLEHLPGGKPKPFKCAFESCFKMFSSKNLLRQHERIHSDERPFECQTCGSKFRQWSVLYRHKATHNKKQK